MNTRDRALLIDLLDEFADRLGNDSCNDWEWPRSWSESYKRDFLDRYNTWADDEEEYHPKYGPNIVSLVLFLRYLFQQGD